MASNGSWFEARRRGDGAGSPCSWEGWLVVGAYFSLLLAAAVLYGKSHPHVVGGFVFLMTLGVMAISRAKGHGPVRWREGDED